MCAISFCFATLEPNFCPLCAFNGAGGAMDRAPTQSLGLLRILIKSWGWAATIELTRQPSVAIGRVQGVFNTNLMRVIRSRPASLCLQLWTVICLAASMAWMLFLGINSVSSLRVEPSNYIQIQVMKRFNINQGFDQHKLSQLFLLFT